MKHSLWIFTLLAATSLYAEPRQVEMKGRIQEIDPLIGGIRLANEQGVKLFTAPDDVLVRERLTRLSYQDLREGDVVAVRFWEDSEKVDRVDILERPVPGTAVAQQSDSPAAVVSQ
jgi:hypothetical protein